MQASRVEWAWALVWAVGIISVGAIFTIGGMGADSTKTGASTGSTVMGLVVLIDFFKWKLIGS